MQCDIFLCINRSSTGTVARRYRYAVLSDEEIKILYMSDEVPDSVGSEYVRAPELPPSAAEVLPLRD